MLTVVGVAIASGGHIGGFISAAIEMQSVEEKISEVYRQTGALPPRETARTEEARNPAALRP